ncbi:MAG TPA: aminotransferase class IV, partial [Microlunatus sp.]
AAGGQFRARFNVAIRTVVIDRVRGQATYGVGGGITWGSTASAEYDELVSKAALLRSPAADFSLLETFGIRHGAPTNLDQHLDRLAESAGYFDIPLDLPTIRQRIVRAATESPDARARLAVTRDGRISLTLTDLPAPDDRPIRLAIDTAVVDRDSRWVYHKTTERRRLEAARQRHPDVDDVVLINDAGKITETTIANIAARIGGTWCTPPIDDGCLPGVGRRLELERGTLVERSISVAELSTAEEIVTISSLRGRRRAVLAADDQAMINTGGAITTVLRR